jgi:hypothetical protein
MLVRFNRNYFSTGSADSQPGCYVGIGWHDHLISLSDATGLKGYSKGIKAISDTQTIRYVIESCIFFLKLVQGISKDIPILRKPLLQSLRYSVMNKIVLRCEGVKRYRVQVLLSLRKRKYQSTVEKGILDNGCI